MADPRPSASHAPREQWYKVIQNAKINEENKKHRKIKFGQKINRHIQKIRIKCFGRILLVTHGRNHQQGRIQAWSFGRAIKNEAWGSEGVAPRKIFIVHALQTLGKRGKPPFYFILDHFQLCLLCKVSQALMFII